MAQGSEADALELNLSCPHGMGKFVNLSLRLNHRQYCLVFLSCCDGHLSFAVYLPC